MKKALSPSDAALAALEAELGEHVVYRGTGRLVACAGWDDCPLDSWGLIVLTPTRVYFHHFPQAHPLLLNRKDADVQWQAARARFDACTERKPSLWLRLIDNAQPQTVLAGPGASLTLEVADLTGGMARAWAASLA